MENNGESIEKRNNNSGKIVLNSRFYLMKKIFR